jgi:hypothetical protein
MVEKHNKKIKSYFSKLMTSALMFSLVALVCGQDFSANNTAQRQNRDVYDAKDVELVTIGTKNFSGRMGSFRIYQAPDGMQVEIDFIRYQTVENARDQVKEWLKSQGEILEQERYNGPQASSEEEKERITIQRSDLINGGKQYVIIKREGDACFFIYSKSLSLAKIAAGIVKDPY